MIKIKNIIFILTMVGNFICFSQDDLLAELESEAEYTSYELPAFKTMTIVNLQSTKIAAKKEFYFFVSHRFGSVKDGFETLFGLDNANTKIQFVYSFFEGVQFSLSRESWRQTYSGSVKYNIVKQSSEFGLNLVGFHIANINAEINEDLFPELETSDRWSFAHQLLISRRFSEKFSFQLAPTYIRENLQDLRAVAEANYNQFALGGGGRFKLSKRISINADYVYNFSRDGNNIYNNPLSIGVDIETGGHVFQILFSNAQSTNEPGFISNAGGDWSEGDIFFGFNIVRVF
ncbi:hypothetical protein SAMN05444278_101237 [Psychroflexus salarius]|uniref:DUF5777 domain-containing protein n=1 Tax=Psychroflexus salarius TaxID=1155689 RepID=A0A1M4SMP6_9FLAO|nr:DUF5777 family beta-barrel protein [Psychroflexus salarius]SHE33448.1 hypothetical protein SAMN05444278_101237 [Psychroflexus salarius]